MHRSKMKERGLFAGSGGGRETGDRVTTASGSVREATLSKGLVLLVDDEPALLRAFSRFLETVGFQVRTAQDGEAALDQLRSTRFDVIISDITMPGMSGIEFLRLVREHDLDVPIVLMTGGPTL